MKIFLKQAGLNDQGNVAAWEGRGQCGKRMEKEKGKFRGKCFVIRSGRDL